MAAKEIPMSLLGHLTDAIVVVLVLVLEE